METVIGQIKEFINESLSSINNISNIEIDIEIPKDKKLGDYSTSIAMKLTKILKQPPTHIANDIVKKLIKQNENRKLFDKIEVVHPGFINFSLSENFLVKELKNIFDKKNDYGRRVTDNNNKTIIEFVSANPTGPLNVVSARAASVGDAISNILKFVGEDIYKEYYINDAGQQVRLLGESVAYRIEQLKGKKVELPDNCYHGEYLIDIAKEIINDKELYQKLSQLKEAEKINFLSNYTVEKLIKSHKKDLKNFNVNFDNWFSEKKLRESDIIDECYKLLKKKNVVYTKDNKIFFKATEYGDEKDRVIIRDDGTPTYFFVDIAYHLNKYSRGFNKIIDLWGPDHDGYIPRMKGAIESLGYNKDSFLVLIVQQVNLIEKSEKVQMSKRAGKFVMMKELIDDIGRDAARFFFLHRSLNSHLDFDMELARKQNEENPVYYIQYAYARICSIFRQAKSQGISLDDNINKIDLSIITKSEEEQDLIKRLIDFPDVVAEAAEKFQPSLITNYLLSIANLFHKFYTVHKVISENQKTTYARLYLIECTRIILKIALDLIGVSAPEKM